MILNKYLKTQHKIVRADNILVLTHYKPDGDAIASVCAIIEYLERIEKKFTAFCMDAPPLQFSFLPNYEKIKFNKGQLDINEYDLILILDCGQASRTGLEKELKSTNVDQYLIEIDHHPKMEDYCDLEIRIDDAAAACEILYYFFKANNIKIDKKIANCLLTGIMTDTGNLLYESTTKDVVKIASEMLVKGAKFPQILDNTWRNKSLNVMKAWGMAMDNLEVNKDYNLAYSVLTQDEIDKAGISEEEMEGIAGFLSNIHGVNGLLFLREITPGKIKGSLRTTHPTIDISKLAIALGGGGHPRASGFVMDGNIQKTEKGWVIV